MGVISVAKSVYGRVLRVPVLGAIARRFVTILKAGSGETRRAQGMQEHANLEQSLQALQREVKEMQSYLRMLTVIVEAPVDRDHAQHTSAAADDPSASKS